MKQLQIKIFIFTFIIISGCFSEKKHITENYNMGNSKYIFISDNEIFVLNIDYINLLKTKSVKAKKNNSFIAYFPDSVKNRYWNNVLPFNIVELENVTNPIEIKPISGKYYFNYMISDSFPYNSYLIMKLENVKFKSENKKIIFNNTFYFPSDTACFNAGMRIEK